jgi:hypothetical protein
MWIPIFGTFLSLAGGLFLYSSGRTSVTRGERGVSVFLLWVGFLVLASGLVMMWL